MSSIKLIFTGSMGSGKTTAIGSISEIPPISTDVRATDEEAKRKATTTVALDYGELTLEDGQKLRLYGTPGQRRFGYMFKILSQGGLGLIILIDDAGENPIEDLQFYLDTFAEFIAETGVVIGITHMDQADPPNLDKYTEFLAARQAPWPAFPIDARNGQDVVMLIETLLALLTFA